MTTYAIGDLQGCYTVFRRLLDKLDFQPSKDTLWLTGDLVNRGPESLETLRFIRSLGNNVITILGNHDLHLLAVAEGLREYKLKDSFVDILKASDLEEILTWLRQQKLIHYDKKLNYTMVHAGIYPTWSLKEALDYGKEVENLLQSTGYHEFLPHLYGNDPQIWDDTLQSWLRLRFITNVLTRMRYLDQHLALDFVCKTPVNKAPPNLRPWFDFKIKALNDTKIVFGHWSALQGHTGHLNIQAIDTGCVWGFDLTALDLETDRRISVKNSK